MASVTFAVSSELKPRLEQFSWVSWSVVAKEALLAKDKRDSALDALSEITKKSKLSDADVARLSEVIKKGMYKQVKARDS